MASSVRADLEGEVYLPALSERRLLGQKLVVFLEKACIELVHIGHGRHELLDGTRHKKLLFKNKVERDLADLRPDIVFQCLQVLLDSPLNRSGNLLVYIRTSNNILIEVSPAWQPPRTYLEFESIMATLLVQGFVKAHNAKFNLLKIVKNDLEELIPPGTRCLGMEVSGAKVDLNDFVRQLCLEEDEKRAARKKLDAEKSVEAGFRQTAESCKKLRLAAVSDFAATREARSEAASKGTPICVFIGAVAKGSPATKSLIPHIEEDICISQFPLSAGVCCAKLCDSFEQVFLYE